ncbi:MAG: hypothetical protein IKM34_01570 [Clostridia bacterium]|nr:hypothetical protein [Clostridia bacterium]
MIGYIVPFFVGLLCVVLGILNMRGNISSLHFYHRHRVSEADRIPFGKKVGLGTMIIGIGVMVFSALSAVTFYTGNDVFTFVGTVFLLTGLVVGLALSFYAMIKYNKGIF